LVFGEVSTKTNENDVTAQIFQIFCILAVFLSLGQGCTTQISTRLDNADLEHFTDLGKLNLLQGAHNKRQGIFHLQQSNMERVGKFSFANRLNDIIPLLSDSWLDKSEKQMKKTLKDKILEIVPAKYDS